MLRTPGKVTTVEAKSTILQISSSYTDGVHTLGAELGVGGLTTELELSLLAVVGALCASFRTFMPGRTRDTYDTMSKQKN